MCRVWNGTHTTPVGWKVELHCCRLTIYQHIPYIKQDCVYHLCSFHFPSCIGLYVIYPGTRSRC